MLKDGNRTVCLFAHHGKELSARACSCLTNCWVLAQQIKQLSFDDTVMEEVDELGWA